jgi:hypothetical protein
MALFCCQSSTNSLVQNSQLPKPVSPHNVCFGSKADMCGAQAHVRFGPIADSCTAANGGLVAVRRASVPAPAVGPLPRSRCHHHWVGPLTYSVMSHRRVDGTCDRGEPLRSMQFRSGLPG